MAIASLPPAHVRTAPRKLSIASPAHATPATQPSTPSATQSSTPSATQPSTPSATQPSTPKSRPARAASVAQLPAHHVADLRDIALGVEETNAGICTKYLLDQNAMSGGEDEGGHLHDIERCLDRYSVFAHRTIASWHMRIKRARRALAAMSHAGQTRDVAVLHVAFGAEDPMTREWPRLVRDYYGRELTSLVRYTDTTEERRRRLVRASCRPVVAPGQHLAELRVVVQLSARREREAYHDRIITSGDALRDALSASQGGERPSFMAASKRDAEAMLAQACGIYWRAWLSTP